jgi:hypothetical protein
MKARIMAMVLGATAMAAMLSERLEPPTLQVRKPAEALP